MRAFGPGGLAAFVLIAIAACSSTEDESIKSVTSEVACADWAKAICGRWNACAPVGLKDAFGDVESCRAWEGERCTAVMATKGAEKVADQKESCARATAALSCDEWLYASQANLGEVCSEHGSLDDGSACYSSEQCDSGFCRVTGPDCGVCGHQTALGTPCTDSYDCEGDLICSSSLCVPPAGAGAECSDDFPCSEAFICVQPDAGTSGVCRKPLREGEPCDPQASACDWQQLRLICDEATSACQSVVLVEVGQPCGWLDGGGYGRCTSYTTFCDSASSTCQPTLAEGAACDADTGAPCTSPSDCIDGVCKVFDADSCR